jgi:hypothetical protein
VVRYRVRAFLADAAAGALPNYSFIQPRYLNEKVLNVSSNNLYLPYATAYGV